MSASSSIVQPDLTMLPAASQELMIRKFLPCELIPRGWSCQERSLIENIRTLYGPSNIRIQMHGSPESMERSLMNFMSFSGHQKYFQIQDSTFYKPHIFLFQSLGCKTYIYKDSIHDLLFEHIPTIHTLPQLSKLAHNLMSYYLRTSKKRLTTLHEMVEINEEFKIHLIGQKMVLEEMMETEEWKKHVSSFAVGTKNAEELLQNINEIFRTEIKAEMDSEMRKTVTMIVEDVPVKDNISAYRKVLIWLQLTIKSFEYLIRKYKLVMFSRSETVESLPTPKILVRLFESIEDKVVMSHELLHAIKLEKLDVSGFEDKILAMPKLSAMNFREVFEMIPSNIFKMLEFIRVPLRNTTKEPYMIPTIDGSYCLSTYQFFMMILCDAIHAKKLFQGMKVDQWGHIMREFYAMLLNILRDGNYFVTIEKYEKTKQLFGTWFKKKFPSPNQKEISKVNRNGFTRKDLKKQLERLELDEIFPGVGEFALKMSAFEALGPTYGCAYEATKQMFQLIQDTHFSYIFTGLSQQLITIFHKRKWCAHFLSNRCPLCSDKQSNEPSEKTAKDCDVAVERKAGEKEESLNVSVVTSSDTANSDEAVEASSTEKSDDLESDCLSSSATVETVVLEQQEPIQKIKKSKKKTEQPVVKQEVKESQACPKCIRASEYTKTTNEKLRLSKIEVKHLKKELSVVELALEEKNERIRILEEKLREKEHQMNLKSSEVETLNTKKQESERKNERNEKLITTFNKVNSKKDLAIKSLQSQNFEKDKLIKDLTSEKSKAIPSRSTEESEKIKPLLSNLLEKKTILSSEDPVKKSEVICEELIAKTNSKVNQQMVKYETKIFQLQVSSYIQTVENNIQLIQGNMTIKVDQIPKIPDFPEFSEEFKNVHKSILKKEAPILCRQLLNLIDEIADMQCLICTIEMESHDGTIKCSECKRRFHNHCIRSWWEKKRSCPACYYAMVDEQEFPAL